MPDLTDITGWIKRLIYRVDRLESGAMLENSSITNGQMTFLGGKLRGLAGAIFEWVGSFNLTGQFNATGWSIFRGPVTITGETGTLEVAANAELHGNTKIGQNLEVTAETLLKGLTKVLADFRVEDNGKIYVGPSMTLDPTVSSGAMVFSNGAQVFTDAGTIQVYKGNGVVQISDAYARLQWGGLSVVLDVDGVHVNGGPLIVQGRTTLQGAAVFMPNLPTASGKGLPPGSLWVDTSDDCRLYIALS